MATHIGLEVEIQDVEYQRLEGKAWLVRVYRPRAAGPFPALLDVHGGAWHNGTRLSNAGLDQALAARGVVVAALDFRQPPEAGYPASVCDVNLGIRWLKAHAAEFNAVSAVGVMGNSSGGHLAILNALRPRDPRYAALPGRPGLDASVSYVLGLWPVIDPLYRYRNVALAHNRQELIDAHHAYWGTEEAMAEGNPQSILDTGEQVNMPPILYLLKANDRNHPIEMQERFIASYRARGGRVEVETFDNLPEHGMVPTPEWPETMRATELMTDFIRRHTS